MAARTKKKRLFSPAKLNLGLWIVGRRSDGLHRLESLFWPIDLVDDIELECPSESPGLVMQWAVDAPIRTPLPAAAENIVARIKDGFPGALPDNLSLRIHKRIPLGGGVGGGSSNAGTLLAELAPQWEDRDLKAAALGADVPFFLDPRPTWVTGIGEKRRALKLSKEVAASLHFLVVCLPQPTPTALIFRALKDSGFKFSPSRNPFPTPSVSRSAIVNYLEWASNDLEPFAVRHYPLIGEVTSKLRETPCLFAGMSGSGSTCFAVFDDATAREKSAKELFPFFRDRGCTSLCVGTF
jgi:4-diphosphocytidyl-2-C-methyl-D-erythritol kinase